MKLTRKQRAAFFAGEWPAIGGEGECPVSVGHIRQVSSRVSFEVTGIHRRKGRWSLEYTVHDDRNEPYLLPAGHRVPVDNSGEPAPMTENEEHGYSHNRPVALDAGTRIPREAQENITKEANKQWQGYMNAVEHDRMNEREIRRLAVKVQRLQAEAMKYGIDITPDLAAFIESAQDRIVAEKKAA